MTARLYALTYTVILATTAMIAAPAISHDTSVGSYLRDPGEHLLRLVEAPPPASEALNLAINGTMAAFTCKPPNQRVEFERILLCVRGLTASNLGVIEDAPLPGRIIQWNASDILRREDELTAAWPTGASYIRISQGGLRWPRVPLVPSELPDMFEERQGFFTYYYPKALKFRGERLYLLCKPTSLLAAPDTDVEYCATLISMPNGLRLTVRAYAGAFYDGGPGWPTLLRDYHPAAWQAALDEVAAFLDLVLISQRER